MRRVLEIVFAHPYRLLLLLLLPAVVGVGVVYKMPRSYQATASLWAVQRYTVIGATGPEANLNATPAQTQATALTELLQTRIFALEVADQTPLASTLSPGIRADQQLRDDALYTNISKGVVATGQGVNLFTITYTNKSPAIAQQVIQAVIKSFGEQSVQFAVLEGQQLLQEYQGQLKQAQQVAASATDAEQKYLSARPTINQTNLNSDPQYALLSAQAQQAQVNLITIQSKIVTLQQQLSTLGSGPNNLFTVLDAPMVPDRAVSRLKQLLLGGGVGLAVSLIGSAIYLIVLARRNHAAYGPDDLRKITPLPVVMEIPYLSRVAVSRTITAPTGEGSMRTRR